MDDQTKVVSNQVPVSIPSPEQLALFRRIYIQTGREKGLDPEPITDEQVLARVQNNFLVAEKIYLQFEEFIHTQGLNDADHQFVKEVLKSILSPKED